MSRVMITGAAGFLGRRLIKAIAEKGTLVGTEGEPQAVTKLLLVDVVDMQTPSLPGIAVETIKGDLSNESFVRSLSDAGFDSLFHLASYLTFRAEEDPHQAFSVNVTALRHLIETATKRAKVVFTSSIAVFGSGAPRVVDDNVPISPQTTYGNHKAINELLIADASRRERIDGRSLRLPIVLTRPGAPQPVVSDRVASIIREPFNGIDIIAPLSPETILPICSAGAVVAALLKLHDLPAMDLPVKRSFNFPSLSVKCSDMASAVTRRGATGAIRFSPDERLQAVVNGWPAQLTSDNATRVGIKSDADIDAIISDYLNHEGYVT